MKLAEYGIAAFVYDKRGSEPSGFPCEEATHDLNVSDINKHGPEVRDLGRDPLSNQPAY